MTESTKTSLFLYLFTVVCFVGAWRAYGQHTEFSAVLAVFGWLSWMCAAEGGE